MELEIRESVVTYIEKMQPRVGYTLRALLKKVGLSPAKFYQWKERMGIPSRHNGQQPKEHWLLPCEKERIVHYAKEYYAEYDRFLRDGYRRLTYRMLDENVVAVSPSSVYRILKERGLLNAWNTKKKAGKGKGFKQPEGPHQHWHVHIKYVNFQGTFLFLISLLDGFSRYIVHHELRLHMTEYDVEVTIQNALDKYPGKRPRIISDNGPQFIAKEFVRFIGGQELVHIKTSVGYPQSNGKLERFHRTLGEECLYQEPLIDLEQARKTIAEYIDQYNTQRLHGSLFYLTPEDFLMDRVQERVAEREAKLSQAVDKRKQYWQQQAA